MGFGASHAGMKGTKQMANSQCKQCGSEGDLLVAFTKHKICGKCTRIKHKVAMGEINNLITNINKQAELLDQLYGKES